MHVITTTCIPVFVPLNSYMYQVESVFNIYRHGKICT